MHNLARRWGIDLKKQDRQVQLIKRIALEPWQHSKESLAAVFQVSSVSIRRDLEELNERGFEILTNEVGQLYLQKAGWQDTGPVGPATLRQMEILRIVHAKKSGSTAKEIKGKILRTDEEVSQRTIERALEGLVKEGTLQKEGERYHINQESLLPDIHLDPLENSILQSAFLIAAFASPNQSEIRSLKAKLEMTLGAREEDREVCLVHGQLPNANSKLMRDCELLEEAALRQRKTLLLYRKREGPAYQVQVEPLGTLYYWGLDHWYLVAQDQDQIKTYSLERILGIEILEASFQRDPGFSLETWFQSAWGVYRDGHPQIVRIRFYDHLTTLQRVRQQLQNRLTVKFRPTEDGFILEDEVEGLPELAVWLRQFGPGAEVLEPPELRRLLQQEFQKMQALYREGARP